MEERAMAAWEQEAEGLRSEIAELEQSLEDSMQQGEADSDQQSALTRAMEVLMRQSWLGERWQKERSGPTMESRYSWLETELEFLSELTGIRFRSYTWDKDAGEQGAVGRHRFSGECFSFPFQLEFELNEVTQVDGQTTASVSRMEVVVDRASNDLSNFIARSEEEKSLMLLLRTIVSYSRWCALRKKTFVHFKTKFPGVVLLPEGEQGSMLLIKNPTVPGPRFLVLWQIEVQPYGLVLPNIQLHVKATRRMEEHGLGGLPGDVSRAFQTLLKLQGVETALACIIHSVQPPQ